MVAVSKPSTMFASTTPNDRSDNIFSSFAHKLGLGTADTTAATPTPPVAMAAKPRTLEPKRVVPHHPMVAAKPALKPQPERRLANARPPLKPSTDATDQSTAAAAATPTPGTMSGAAPVISSSSFDSRFSAIR